MIDQRITVPKEGMVFGDSTEEMVNEAYNRLPRELRGSYEPALIIACPCGFKRRLGPVWSIRDRHYQLAKRHYGKVTFTLKAEARQSFPIQEELF